MLARAHRLRDGRELSAVVRAGARGGSRSVIVHADLAAEPRPTEADPPARVGFVVSKRVGGSVVRNRVQRRLRHLVADRLEAMPAGARVVVRATPAAAEAGPELGDDLDRAMRKALRVR